MVVGWGYLTSQQNQDPPNQFYRKYNRPLKVACDRDTQEALTAAAAEMTKGINL